jgi:hypothetical protein
MREVAVPDIHFDEKDANKLFFSLLQTATKMQKRYIQEANAAGPLSDLSGRKKFKNKAPSTLQFTTRN